MTPEQISEFLENPRLADLATVRPDGSPHVAPVWYDYDGTVFRVLVDPTAIKIRNARRNDRVAMSIPTHEPPYAYVLVNGTAKISEEEYWPLLQRMSVRYLGKEEGERYARKTYEDLKFVVLTVTPSRVTGWRDGE